MLCLHFYFHVATVSVLQPPGFHRVGLLSKLLDPCHVKSKGVSSSLPLTLVNPGSVLPWLSPTSQRSAQAVSQRQSRNPYLFKAIDPKRLCEIFPVHCLSCLREESQALETRSQMWAPIPRATAKITRVCCLKRALSFPRSAPFCELGCFASVNVLAVAVMVRLLRPW